MKKLVVSLALVSASVFAWAATPTLQEVETQVQQGHYDRAEAMMSEVVAAKPGSARAHYVYAEVLAHDGKFAKAADEARLARQIDPDVKFTTAEKFRAFEDKLQQAQAAPTRTRVAPSSLSPSTTSSVAPAVPMATAPAPAASGGVPAWLWGAGLAVVGFLLWRSFSRSREAVGPNGAVGSASYGGGPIAPNAGAPVGMPYGVGPNAGVGQGYAPARPSSGMLGVGLAAAGGVAAGMLAEQYLHRRPDQAADTSSAQPGFFDSPQGGSAGADLESRPIDFGTGGSDWDSGSVDAGGGGGSDSGGGWD